MIRSDILAVSRDAASRPFGRGILSPEPAALKAPSKSKPAHLLTGVAKP